MEKDEWILLGIVAALIWFTNRKSSLGGFDPIEYKSNVDSNFDEIPTAIFNRTPPRDYPKNGNQ